jgi:hypothetical protein
MKSAKGVGSHSRAATASPHGPAPTIMMSWTRKLSSAMIRQYEREEKWTVEDAFKGGMMRREVLYLAGPKDDYSGSVRRQRMEQIGLFMLVNAKTLHVKLADEAHNSMLDMLCVSQLMVKRVAIEHAEDREQVEHVRGTKQDLEAERRALKHCSK